MKKKAFKIVAQSIEYLSCTCPEESEKVPIACSRVRVRVQADHVSMKRKRAGLVSAPRIGGKKKENFLNEEVLDIQ